MRAKHLHARAESSQLSTVSDTRDIKAEAHRLIDGLPAHATWDDLMYEVYVRQAVEAGLSDVEAGRLIPHDEAIARAKERIRAAS
jgi:predicted transcriptional regulator